MDSIDKAANLLAFARRHNLSLTAIGDKLQIKKESQDQNNNLDIVVSTLAANKVDIIAILQDPDAIRQWLGDTQKSLSVNYDSLLDGMDRWRWVEEVYHNLFPDNQECVCSDGHCIETALVTCNSCIKPEKNKERNEI